MKLVIYPPVEASRLEKIVQAAGEMSVVNAESEQAAAREIADADALFGKVTPPMLAAAKRLRWVQSATASLEHYMFAELIEHPCTLTNMRGLYSDVIADHVFSYILCFARNLHRYIRQQMRAHWEAIGGEPSPTTFAAGTSTVSAMDREHLHLSDCVLGIVGLGNIGREIARRGRAFSMRVVAVDPIVPAAPEGVETLWRPEHLSKLLSASDFVVIAAPHTPETVKMFRRPQFGQMKSTAYLINIGRGVIVDLADLTDALRAGQIRGAALDVFEVEPLPADHSLWQMENVLITPHVAAASVHIAERHLAVVLDNIRRFVAGERLVNVTRKEKWY